MRVLDSHLHLWDPSRLDYEWLEGPLRERFAADELLAARGADTINHGAVFVQADCAESQYLDEVAWVESLADRLGVLGVVAGARLDRGEQSLTHLDALAQRPLVRGVRHLLEPEPVGFASTDAFRAGASALIERGLTFDACVRGGAQLRDVIALAAALPSLPIVVDHLGKPQIGTAETPLAPDAEWLTELMQLAAHDQVMCKLSGLPSEAAGSWSATQIEPFFDAALDAFGPDRLMIGSDWPVSAVSASGWAGTADLPAIDANAIPSWITVVEAWATSRGIDVDAVLWRNAERFYRLCA